MIISHIRQTFFAAFFPRLSEWTAAGVIFAIGWMLSANETLMNSGSGRGYVLMLGVASQQVWSNVLILFGLGRLVVLLVNGAWRRSPHLRAATAFFSCLLWTQIVLSFAPTFGFAFVMAGGYLAMDMINVFRAMRDARTIDDAFARGEGSGTK